VVFKVVEIQVLDEQVYTEYVEKVPAAVAKHGGRLQGYPTESR